MSMMDVPRCQHIKVNGVQCGSPALHRKRHCFFHSRARTRHARMLRHNAASHPPILPFIEDANSVHLALVQVIQQMLLGTLEFKVAAKAISGLNAVSRNLKLTTFEPARVTDVVIDRTTVSQTCIGGPQWIEEEFTSHDERDEPQENEPQDDGEPNAALAALPEKMPEKMPSASAGADQGLAPLAASKAASEAASNGATGATKAASKAASKGCHSEPVRSGGEEPYLRPTPPLQPTSPTPPPLPPAQRQPPPSTRPTRPYPGTRPSWNDLEDQRLGIVRPAPQQASPETVKLFHHFCAAIDRSRAQEEAEQKAASGEVEAAYNKKKSTLKKCRGQ